MINTGMLVKMAGLGNFVENDDVIKWKYFPLWGESALTKASDAEL